ncbi:hypothetical protein AK88_04294 [Plasmodium fragile]|uniref:Schizont-infected cell agglutination extracellular alpha domain-containing protein n=1 Tax=Plasmodium fragile TaxID=5857 RepID=A0A0D9QGU6_PLAFR|nr:uncharacterized protein AK88_04294 [Plasmodium fragile]KJP86037.1 hypothetical protein AK88_04294 [Plasmodium fragile]
MLYLQEHFWKNVETVWKEFRHFMERMQDGGLAGTMCESAQGDQEADGHIWTGEDLGICELTITALHFKHGIELAGAPPRAAYTDEETKHIDLYMRCILVNIFMKKIMGMKCLARPGGQFAFGLVHDEVKGVLKQEVGNVECEWKDAGIGGDGTGRDATDRDLWEVMTRWNENNRQNTGDGQWGVLGQGCKVEKKGTAKVGDGDTRQALKEKVQEEIKNVEEDIKVKVSTILTGIRVCSHGDDNCVKNLLQKKQQEEKNQQDSSSKTAEGNGQSRPSGAQASSPSLPARPPPPPPRRPSTPRQISGGPGRGGSEGGARVGGGKGPVLGPPSTSSSQPGKSDSEIRSPAAAVPAPADNHTPAKPVAAKPAPATKTAQPGAGEDCPWMSIDHHKRRPVHVLQYYDSAELKALKAVLQAFIDYMQQNTDKMDAYGANCDNSGWDDFGHGTDYHTGQTVADVIRCRLMTLALFFANQEGKHGNSEKAQKTDDDKLYEKFRCEVANVFGYMLQNQYCKKEGWKRGVEYAWKTLKKMHKDKHGNILFSGPVMHGTCKQCGYVGSMTKPGIINGHIAEWFVTEGIMGEIAHIEQQLPCHKDWKKYKTQKGGTDNTVIENDKIPEVTTMEKTVLEDTEKAIEKAKAQVDAAIATDKKPAEGGGGDQKGEKPSAPSPLPEGASGVATGTPSGQPRSDSSAGDAQPAAGAAAAGPGAGQPPQATPPAPAGPSPPGPPGASAGTGSTSTGIGAATGTTGNAATGENNTPTSSNTGKESVHEQDEPTNVKLPGSFGSISVVFSTTYNSGAPSQEHMERYENTTDPQSTGNEGSGTATTQDPEAASEPTGVATVEGTTDATKKAKVSVQDTAKDPGHTAPSTHKENQSVNGDPATVAIPPDSSATEETTPAATTKLGTPSSPGGNEDPPPLNPPKPTANADNTDQKTAQKPDPSSLPCGLPDPDPFSSFAGGTSSCGQGNAAARDRSTTYAGTDANSSRTRGGCDSGRRNLAITPRSQNDLKSDSGNPNEFRFDPTNITPPGIGNVAGGIAPPTLDEKKYHSVPDNRGEKPGDYAVPDLTADVFTATTPVLFFLSAVTLALLGYSLWKVTAHNTQGHTQTHDAQRTSTHKYNRVEKWNNNRCHSASTVSSHVPKRNYNQHYTIWKLLQQEKTSNTKF